MSPIPEPGHGPIAGSVLHFGTLAFVFTIFLMIAYVTWARNNSYLLFAPVVLFAVFTEEIVFEVLYTWSLDLLYLSVLVPIILVNNQRFELPRSMTLAYCAMAFVCVLAFGFSLRFVGSVTPPRAAFTRLLRETGRWLLLLALPLIFYVYLDSRRTWVRLVNTHLMVSGILSLISLLWLVLTYAGIMPLSFAAIFIEPGGVTLRLTGTFTEPSQFATYLTLSLLVGIGPAIERTRRGQLFSVVWFVPMALALLFTYSTSAFVMLAGVAFVGSLFVFDVLALERKSILGYFGYAIAIIAGGTTILILVGLGLNFVLKDVFASAPNLPGPTLLYVSTIGKLITITDSARWFAFVTDVRMWLENPILGAGLGNHFFLYPEYSVRSLSSGRGPVSTFLNVLTSTGLVGLLAFVLYLTEVHRQVRAALSATISNDDWIILGVYLMFFGLVIGYNINPNFRTVFNAVFLGFVLGSAQYASSES